MEIASRHDYVWGANSMTQEIVYQHNDWGYFQIYNKLTGKYPNKPTWMFKELSGLVDHQVELQNNIALDILSPRTRESAYSFAYRCGYDPIESNGSTTTLTITLTGAMAKTLPIGYQNGGVSSITGNFVYFELTAVGDSGGTDTITVAAMQKRTYTDIAIGTILSQDNYYELPINGYTNIIRSSISLTINSLGWTRVDNFDNSISTDRHFLLYYQNDGKTIIIFPNGVNGEKPPLNEAVTATFSTTNGLNGIMNANEIIVNVGGDTDVLTVDNAAKTSGGNNPESITSIIRNARVYLRSKNIVWSKADLELYAKVADSSVVKALGIPGIGNTNIHIIPSGGGAPGAPLKAIVDTFVTSKTQFGVMPVTVSDPNYLTAAVTADITVITGYMPAKVQDLVEFAMTLVTCAYDNQVTEAYIDNGINKTRTDIINILWAWAFAEADEEALEFIVNKWLSLLGSRDYRDWDQDLEIGQLWIMGDSMYSHGVDVFSLTLPIANVTTTQFQIIDSGVITVNLV